MTCLFLRGGEECNTHAGVTHVSANLPFSDSIYWLRHLRRFFNSLLNNAGTDFVLSPCTYLNSLLNDAVCTCSLS